MPDVRIDIKEKCRLQGKTISDLCRATGIPYQRLSGAVNGYWFLNDNYERLVRFVFQRWEEEAKQQTAQKEI